MTEGQSERGVYWETQQQQNYGGKKDACDMNCRWLGIPATFRGRKWWEDSEEVNGAWIYKSIVYFAKEF